MSHGTGATRGNQRGAKSLQAERADTRAARASAPRENVGSDVVH